MNEDTSASCVQGSRQGDAALMDAQQAFPPPVVGYPPAIQEPVVIINNRQYAPLSDQPRRPESTPLQSCIGWVALAAIVCFVLFLWVTPGDASVWGCPAGCHRDPWASAGAADSMLPGNETLFADPAWQKQQASELLSSWGFATGKRSFMALVGAGLTLDDVVGGGPNSSSAVVLVVLGKGAPSRRSERQPFLTVTGNASGGIGDFIYVAAVNTAAAGFENVLGRRLFPFTVETAKFGSCDSHRMGPYAAYDVAAGRIILDRCLLLGMQQLPPALLEATHAFSHSLFSQLSRFVAAQGADVTSLATVGAVVGNAAAVAASVAIGYQLPIWFCVACPAVLGLLAPLLINAAAGAIANAACKHYHLPQPDCADLWWSALAVAMVLSIAAAIPIVFVCRLPECARRSEA